MNSTTVSYMKYIDHLSQLPTVYSSRQPFLSDCVILLLDTLLPDLYPLSLTW